MKEGILASSPNKGRYIIDDPEPRYELTSGMRIAVLLGGHWIEGQVAIDSFLYASDLWVMPRTLRGYFFIADDNTRCGLCVGMRVRIL
jgi:hypothetical protein